MNEKFEKLRPMEENGSLCRAMTGILEQQAEISFKAGEKLSLEKQGQAYLEGKQAGIKEVVELLGLCENEMGFCEISNHVPYSVIKEWG